MKQMMIRKICITLILCGIVFTCCRTADAKISKKGIWITCFTKLDVLYSRENVFELIEYCKVNGLNQIYLQLYRADQAYYDSSVTDRTKFDLILDRAGEDTVSLLIKEAQKEDIDVFAWINALSLSINKKAHILEKYGMSVLTKDQYGRSSWRRENKSDDDKYYLRPDQYFLEPGDPRVFNHVQLIADEIITRYPDLSGIHLDYIRYPHQVPFLPGSRFNDFGLTYGYGEKNVERFMAETGIEPQTAGDREALRAWDDWNRNNVTKLVRVISENMRQKHPHMQISCAVLASPIRAYDSAYQNWPLWLKDELVDYIVLMNYSENSELVEWQSKMAQSLAGKGDIYIGLGAYLMERTPEVLRKQYRLLDDMNAKGVVFFSYDSIVGMDTSFID